VFVALGLLAKNAQAAAGYTILVTLLAFVSGALVPVGTMPGWLQPIARHQPFTVIVEAARGLVLPNYAAAADPFLALAWIVAIVLVFAPYAVWLYTRT
jgi:ABC-2 type transport system permease protein